MVRRHVQQAIRSLLHVADPLVELGQQRDVTHRQSPLVEDDALQLGGGHPADEQAPLPRRKRVARIEGHAAGRDDGVPVEQRLLHAGRAGLGQFRARPAGADRGFPGVRAAVRDDRPAVVPARPDDVELVAALRAVLHLPELARLGMNDQA